MAKLVIFGTGDIARLAHFYFTRDSPHEVAAFTVDRAYRNANTFLDLPVVEFETIAESYPPDDYQLFVAVSYARMNQVRAEKFQRAKAMGYTLPSYVSSRCSFLTDHAVGENCLILEDTTVQPFVRIGDNVTLWSGGHVGHDSVIEDHCFLAPNIAISGNVHVGRYCFIGVNATLRNSITIAPHSLIGAGAVIMNDTVERGVYIPRRTEAHRKTSDQFNL